MDPFAAAMAASLLLSAAALAAPQPDVAAVNPPWVTVGTTSEVTLTGSNLAGAKQVVIDGPPGVAAELIAAEKPDPGIVKVKLNIAPDAALGPREIRLIGPGGVSNVARVAVGMYRLNTEVEPNNTRGEAQPVELPATLAGLINGGADIDMYRFKAAKNQRLVFDVHAARDGSPLDASLKLLNESGNVVASDEDTNGFDSLIDYTAPAEGTYTLVIHDVQYRGGGDYRYRIEAGAIPYVKAIFPLGASKGQSAEVKLFGPNLGEADVMRVDLAQAEQGLRYLRAETPVGRSNPLPFDVSDLSESIEAEPNDGHSQANAVQWPVVVNGRIERSRDTDRFRFKVEQAMKLELVASARRYGSKLDPLLTLYNAEGGVLARNDDAGGLDARIERDFAPGEYVVGVEDLTSHGGAEYGYRLTIQPPRPPRPDFAVRVMPDRPRVSRGSHMKLWCEVIRTGGFTGPVTLQLTGLPEGLNVEPNELTAEGAISGVFVVSATGDAPLGAFTLNMTATGKAGEQTITKPVAFEQGGGDGVERAYLTVLDAPPFTVRPAAQPGDDDIARKDAELAALEAQLYAPSAELDAALARWTQQVTEQLKAGAALSPWHHIGPFACNDMNDGFNREYEPEKQVALDKTYEDGKLKWQPRPEWADGQVHNVFNGDNTVNYIYRTIEVTAARPLNLSLGSDDAVKLFHNGKQVVANNVGRGAAPDQEKVTLELTPGRNTILMKVINGGGPSGFYFRADTQSLALPDDVTAALRVEPDQRTEAHKRAMFVYHRSIDPTLQPIRDKIAVVRGGDAGVRIEIARLNRQLESPAPELAAQLAAEQARWEQTLDTATTAWVPLKFHEMKSAAGARFNRDKNNVIRIAKAVQSKDDYSLAAHTEARNITAIRLEALPHAQLPAKGPGLADNGNFVLSEFKVVAAPKGDPAKATPVEFASSNATFEQQGWPIVNTYDGNANTGWAIHPEMGKPHTAMYRLKAPAGHEGGTLLTFTLEHQSVHERHILGAFRISVTTAADPKLDLPTLPGEVADILAVPADQRDDKQKERLAAYYRTIAPSLEPVRQRLAQLNAMLVKFPPEAAQKQSTTLVAAVDRASGFTGPVTVTVEGFSAGRDGASRNPNPITNNLDLQPATLDSGASVGVVTLTAKEKAEQGTRLVVLRAESKVGDETIVQYSRPFPLTVK